MKELQPKRTDYLSALRRESHRKTKKKSFAGQLVTAILLALLPVALAAGVLGARICIRLLPELALIAAYTGDADNQALYEQALAKESDCAAAESERAAYDDAFAAIGSYPELDSAAYGALQQAFGGRARLRALSYDRDTGMLSVSASSSASALADAGVAELRESGRFAGVWYYGYQQENGQTTDEAGNVTSSTEFVFTVTCLLAKAGGDGNV